MSYLGWIRYCQIWRSRSLSQSLLHQLLQVSQSCETELHLKPLASASISTMRSNEEQGSYLLQGALEAVPPLLHVCASSCGVKTLRLVCKSACVVSYDVISGHSLTGWVCSAFRPQDPGSFFETYTTVSPTSGIQRYVFATPAWFITD